jgi:hypothetical protein
MMAEWTVINGYSGCDCADLLEDDPLWGTDEDEDYDDDG